MSLRLVFVFEAVVTVLAAVLLFHLVHATYLESAHSDLHGC